VTSFTHDAANRMTQVIAPEGNKRVLTYDARGNLLKTTAVPKTGYPGTASIITSAGYPSTCANVVTCNKPTYSRDAKGNQTDYTYNSSTGLVATVTSAAPVAGGIRPQTRYTYLPLQAYYKNSAGSIVASGQPITKLSASSTCQTLASCVGTVGEIKTTIG
jgi:YD repeat-containing protein